MAIDPARTAVLSLDLQAGVVSVYVKDDAFVPRLAALLSRARTAGMTLVHVKMGLRPGVPEASPRNRFLSAVKASPRHQQFFQGESGAIHPALAPAAGDLVVTKTRVSAFAGTDLDLLLRAHDITTLVVFGLITSGAVLATVEAAFDLDYDLVVVKDCCADADIDLHQALVDKHFARMATVIDAATFDTLSQELVEPQNPREP